MLHEIIHRPLSSSFLRLPYRVLNINHKKELLRGLWVVYLDPLWSLAAGKPDLHASVANCGPSSLLGILQLA